MLRRATLVRVGPSLAAVATLAVPSIAAACAVCFGGEDSDWTLAFTLGTIMMMVLPPGIVACAVFVIRRSMKRRQAYLDAHAGEAAAHSPAGR